MRAARWCAALLAVGVLTGPGAAESPDRLPVTELDALRFDNFVLRLRLHDAELERLQATIRQRETALQAERAKLDADWRAKYGVGLDQTVRDEQGFSRRPAGPPKEPPR